MKRRLLISVLCLSLAGLVPAPLSACAMLMAPAANCAPVAAKPSADDSHCAQAVAVEETKQNTLRAEASKLPCCAWTAAPAVDVNSSNGKVTVSPVALAAGNAPLSITLNSIEQSLAPTEREPFISPQDRQSLLSVFLI